MFEFLDRPKPISRSELREVRSSFEDWATSKGFTVGRDEMGYYWDDEEGAAAWETWKHLTFGERPYSKK